MTPPHQKHRGNDVLTQGGNTQNTQKRASAQSPLAGSAKE
jgi:hypothetical protein